MHSLENRHGLRGRAAMILAWASCGLSFALLPLHFIEEGEGSEKAFLISIILAVITFVCFLLAASKTLRRIEPVAFSVIAVMLHLLSSHL